jgi:hypothetical protein
MLQLAMRRRDMHLTKIAVLICGLLGLTIILVFPLRIVEPGMSYLLFSEFVVVLVLVPKQLLATRPEGVPFQIAQRRLGAMLLFLAWESLVLAALNVLSIAPLSLFLQGVVSGVGVTLYLALMFALLQIGDFGSAVGEAGFRTGLDRRASHNTVFTVILLFACAPILAALVVVSASTSFARATPTEIALVGTALLSFFFGLILYSPARMALPKSRATTIASLFIFLAFVAAGLEMGSRDNWLLFACSLVSLLGLFVGVLRIAAESIRKPESVGT